MQLIDRPIYLNKIRPFYKQQLIKVIVGQRRCGKTFLLYLIRNDLQKRFPNANFIFIDKESIEFDHIKDYKQLYYYIKNKLKPEANFLFINEVQQIHKFELALIDLINKPEIDIYCTGSNAQLLSSELATLLSGRQILIYLHPLSFTEFLNFHKLKPSIETLEKYMKIGGLPYLIHLPDDDHIRFEYIRNIIDTIIYRDILSRYSLRESYLLTDILKFLATSVGGLISAKRIANFLKSQGINKSVSAIMEILNLLSNAFIVNQVNRWDVKGGHIFERNSKFYFEDIGIRNALVGFKAQDIGQIMENIVYNQLKVWGFDVYIGWLRNAEIDFVAVKRNQRFYIQVAYLLSNDKTIAREFGNLLKINDAHPKFVISLDPLQFDPYKGIKHIKLIDFLLAENFTKLLNF